jgi:hypothetical protein
MNNQKNNNLNNSGLLRSALNDVKRMPHRVISYANDLWAFSPKNKAVSLTSLAWGNALRSKNNSKFSAFNFGLPRRSYLTAHNDGTTYRRDGTPTSLLQTMFHIIARNEAIQKIIVHQIIT